MITAHEVLGFILGDAPRIATAISTGAGWEVWMQVELACLFRARGLGVAREVPYPSPHQRLHLDLTVQDKEGLIYAFEMKVESAQHATPSAMLAGIGADVEKIKLFDVDYLEARNVIGIAYSVPVNASLEQLAEHNGSSVLYGTRDSIGVALIDANTYAPSAVDLSSRAGKLGLPVIATSLAPPGSGCLAQFQSCIEKCEQSVGTDPEQLAECLQRCVQAYLKYQSGS
ncbi:MAG TPA: hypothetical protein VF017_02710 [Thermoanaerobaculia bacterium]|nr:hypothetical protein [Thermoanaerobaculia bacterium]